MLKYCMDTYGSLEPLRQVMNDHPFTLRVKLPDDGDRFGGRAGRACEVENPLRRRGRHRETAGCGKGPRSVSGRCPLQRADADGAFGGKRDKQKVKSLGEALASCPTLKNFEIIAVGCIRNRGHAARCRDE